MYPSYMDIYYLSEYYFNKETPSVWSFNLTDREQREARLGRFDGFIPIAKIKALRDKPDKKYCKKDFRLIKQKFWTLKIQT